MTAFDSSKNPLAGVLLGDIVTVPPDRSLTARARVALDEPVGSMSGFVICGELECLLSAPAVGGGAVLLYTPTPHLPPGAAAGRVGAAGVTSWWAPHLPAVRGAMGELAYRVVELRSAIDPIVCVYRGAELIVFVRTAVFDPSQVSVLAMRRSDHNDVDVTRVAAIVTAPDAPPAHLDVPVRQPARALPVD